LLALGFWGGGFKPHPEYYFEKNSGKIRIEFEFLRDFFETCGGHILVLAGSFYLIFGSLCSLKCPLKERSADFFFKSPPVWRKSPHTWAGQKDLAIFRPSGWKKSEIFFMLKIIKNDAPEGLGDSKTQN
jgi:hypothetical protein